MAKPARLTRGMVAKLTGCNIETIRYYEQIGLMPPPPRSQGGHRLYHDELLRRLNFIRRSRELGFSLNDVRGLLSLVDGQSYTCAEVREVTLAHRDVVRRKIADLRRLERSLKDMAEQCTGDTVPECPVIDVLWSGIAAVAAAPPSR